MPELLLPTKLFIPPQRPLLIPRPRLIDQLDRGQNGKLTLVAAPAGFGKTTLVTTWLAGKNNRPAAWLSLDENDNRFPRFFTYFIAAAQTIYPELAQGLSSSLRTSSPPDDGAILQVLLHELASMEHPLMIVLDDYHAINNEAIHEALDTLIDYMPPTLHITLISREDPPLALPRWRVRDQLTEIRVSDLRFNLDEAAAFLQQTMGLKIEESDIATLENRTEGWVAGLQLAALTLRESGLKNDDAKLRGPGTEDDTQAFIADFSGSSRHVADYLLEEVLNHQPVEVQAFLLQTSLLDRFCADLCDFVLEERDRHDEIEGQSYQSFSPKKESQKILNYLENANLFLIPLDTTRHWYRYHHLFAQLLQDRLFKEMGQARVHHLLKSTSRWFAVEGLREEAIHYALQGQEFDEAARLLASIPSDAIWDQGNISSIQQWGELIPTKSLRKHPRSLIAVASAYLITGDMHNLNNILPLCHGIDSIYGEYAVIKSTLMRNQGNFNQALHLAREAGEFLPEEETTMRAVALVQIANNLIRLGELDQAEKIVNQARILLIKDGQAHRNMHLQAIQMQGAVALMKADIHTAYRFFTEGRALAEQSPPPIPPMVGVMYSGLGQVYYEWNELAESADAYAQARIWADRTGISDIRISTLFGEIELMAQKGERAALNPIFEAFRSFARQAQLQDVTDQTECLIASFHLRLGALDEAVRWANASGLGLTDKPESTQRFFYQVLSAIRLAEARAMGLRENLPQLLALIDYIYRQAKAGHYINDLIEINILKALAYDFGGDQSAALRSLQEALDLAQPGGLVRTFIDQDPVLATLLAQMDSHYADLLSEAFQQEIRFQAKNEVSPTLDLTPREYEILKEISAGLSNKEIEEKLVISRNTVRTHIKNLYSKLGVTSRTQAIRKARELNLI